MAKPVSITRFSVQVIEAAVLARGPYRIVLELDEKVVPAVARAADRPADGLSREFSIESAGIGRLTIEKERPLKRSGSFALEDSYEFSVQFTGKHPLTFRFITTQPEKFPCPAPGAGASTARPEPPEVRNVARMPAGVELVRGKDHGWTLRLTISEPADAQGEMKKPGSTGAARWRPTAHVIPGKSAARRALVFSGVHPSEPEGVRVVNELLEIFSKRGPAAYTTVVIPVLIPRASSGPDQAGPRYVPSADNERRSIEPNRNFPLPGHSHATARELGLWYPDGAELLFCGGNEAAKKGNGKNGNGKKAERQHFAAPPQQPDAERLQGKPKLVSQRLMPETALLLALIEELKPERIISVHAHQQKPNRSKGIGDNAGIFVDPRPGSEAEDDELAAAMVQAFSAKYEQARKSASAQRGPPQGRAVPRPDFSWDPLRGNRSFQLVPPDSDPERAPLTNLHYKPAKEAGAQPGTSFGGWAPRPVSEAFAGVSAPRGNRAGIPVITIECPLADEGGRRKKEQHVELLAAAAESTAPSAVAPILVAAAVGEDFAPRREREAEVSAAAAREPEKKARISFADSNIVESIHAQVIYEIALGGPGAP